MPNSPAQDTTADARDSGAAVLRWDGVFHMDAVVESHEGSRRAQTRLLADAPAWEWNLRGGECGEGAWQGELVATLCEGTEPAATVGLRLTFPSWSEEVYVLLPGAVYAGNRFPVFRTSYSPKAPRGLHRPGLPLQTEVPRLSHEPGPSCLRQMSSDPAFPGIGLYFPQLQQGLWILTPSHNELGLFGYELEENEARDAAALTIFSPGMRREFSYKICCDRVPSADRARDFLAGETVRIPLRLERFACGEPQGLFDRLPGVRRRMVPPPRVRHDIPFSEVWNILEDKYLRENWVEPHGYFSVGVEPMRSRHHTQNWQMGWTGGMIAPHALFLRGGEVAVGRALRNFDFVFERGQAPSGYFYPAGDGERFYTDAETPELAGEKRSLVRKHADGLFYMLSTLAAAEARGMAGRVKPQWIEGLRRCADAFVKTWRDHGEWGHFVNFDTGEVVIPGSASGGIAPAALVLAARRFPDRKEDYLRVAQEAADHFDREYLRRGFTNGGPGDAAQCPDSESAAGLIESFVTLYEETGDARWREAGVRAALHALSWTVSYDFPFPAESTFGKLDMLANGTVLANAQNKHSAPGICTHSGRSLLRLFRHTGLEWIMDLLRDIAHTLPQYMSRADRPIPWTMTYNLPENPAEKTLRPGWMCERVNLTFWGGQEQPGEVFYYSCWSEISLLLTMAELPGIYARPETGRVWAIDHLDARFEGDKLLVTNPTRWPAKFSVLIETAEQALSGPLCDPAAFACYHAAPGETIVCSQQPLTLGRNLLHAQGVFLVTL